MKLTVLIHQPLPRRILFELFVNSSELLCYFTVWAFFFNLCSAIDVKVQKEKYVPDYNIYHNLSSLQREITSIVNRNPNFMKIEREYESRDKISQLVLHITNFTGSTNTDITKYTENSRLKILFAYGVHAREFLPTESLIHLLKNLTSGLRYPRGSAQYKFSKFVLTQVDLYIISVANPDGRKHIEETKNYCWRGTKLGVDLDRNFGWEYGKKGSSSNPEDEEYRGLHKFSEPECLAFTDLTDRMEFDLFISFHSGIKHIYIPYADTRSKKIHRRPDHAEDMLDLAMELSHSTDYQYRYGEVYKISDYTADGTIFDFMAGVRKIPFSYTIELWGQNHKGASCFDLFNPHSDQLQEVLQTIHPLYVKLFSYMINWKSDQVSYITEGYVEGPSMTFGYTLVILTALITLVVCLSGKFRIHPRRRIVSLKSLSSSFSSSFIKT